VLPIRGYLWPIFAVHIALTQRARSARLHSSANSPAKMEARAQRNLPLRRCDHDSLNTSVQLSGNLLGRTPASHTLEPGYVLFTPRESNSHDSMLQFKNG
jgi:hypothetical protein